MKKSKFNIQLVLLHLAALLFGGTAVFSKILPIPSNDIILSRSGLSCFFLGLFFFFSSF